MVPVHQSVVFRRINVLVCAMAALTLLAGCMGPPKVVTTETLLKEMTDLRGLAEFPDPPFTCRQFSSYDRASVSPEDHEKWFANGDCGQYLREEKVGERTEYVMADMDGPGAIVRIWSANPRGTMRVYLDGNETPEIECPMADFLGGKVAWNPPPISCEVSRGWNSYFPIPYAKHCKVTSDQKDFYYHVNYRTYPRRSRVNTFEAGAMASVESLVKDTLTQLASSGPAAEQCQASYGGSCRTTQIKASVPPGEVAQIAGLAGRAEVRELVLHVDGQADADTLRKLILEVKFDGRPCIAAPIGDFFAAGPGSKSFGSLPLGVSADGTLWSRWVMPFRREAQFALVNHSQTAVGITGHVCATDAPAASNMLHFHAATRVQNQVPTRPMIDWNYLDAAGKGVFVGASFNIANPVREWWGEGDEKIFVDGEDFPSHFGTGTEDYYGYAWCCNVPFQHAYHNQPRCDGPHNYGYTSVNRWHILDKIPFSKSFKFDMELWHWNADTKVDMAVTAYWYARPGATDEFPPLDPKELRVAEIPPYAAPRTPGAIEGEEMTLVEKTGAAEPQGIFQCSNETHLWWHEGHKVGDKLVLAFNVPAAGTYNVLGRFVKAADYGTHQLYVNDVKLMEPFDFYNNGVTVTGEIGFGNFDLKQGENRLTVEVVGANEKAIPKYMFGLDYLRIEPQQAGNRQ